MNSIVNDNKMILLNTENEVSSDSNESIKINYDNNNTQIKNNNEIEINQNNNNTKIQLSFSVDRLLNKIDSKHNDNQSVIISHNHNILINQDYDCCRNLNNVANVLNEKKIHISNIFLNPTIELNRLQLQHNQLCQSSDLIKSIIRPTPIRVANNNSGHSNHQILTNQTNYSNNFQTVLKFQQLNSELVSPLNSLKSLQTTQFRNSLSHHDTNSANLTGRPIIPITTVAQTHSISPAASKRKRSWSRAVFSNLQRKGLEYRFQQQKYITKPDRRKLANQLNLTDAQVKVWFQNRRMKWRHTRENFKSGQEKPVDECKTSSDDDDDDYEIDVVAE